METRHTMIINANMTAYSTAVGPSSETRKRCTFKARVFIASSKRCGCQHWSASEPPKTESARHSDSHKPPACLAPGRDSNFKCSPRHRRSLIKAITNPENQET